MYELFNTLQLYKSCDTKSNEYVGSSAANCIYQPAVLVAISSSYELGFSFLVVINLNAEQPPVVITKKMAMQPVLRTTTKKRPYFVRNRSFCRFIVVFLVFISFRRLRRLLSVRHHRFFVVFCRFLGRYFFK